MTAELHKEICKYIIENSQVEAPALQKQFSISYSECNVILEKLTKEGVLEFVSGITYKVNQKKSDSPNVEVYVPKNEQEATFIKALWECIKSGSASTSNIQRKCSTGYATAARAINWMEDNGFVSPANGPMPRDVLISQGDFIKRFGSPDDEGSVEEEDTDNFMERRRRELIERLSHMDDDEEEDADDDDKDADEGDDDIDKAAQERREYLEKRRQELIERMQQEMEDDEEDDDKEQDYAKCAEALKSEIRQMPNYNADDDTFSIAMNVSYPNGAPFRIKVLEHDGCWYLSDLGDALKYLSLFNDRDMLAEYFCDALKTENMCFIEDAVCTTIDDIHDLSGEASFLFKVVNGLITQKYFDVYYLGDKILMLAESILKENDAEMLVNALSVLNEKQVRVSALQKKLHIGHARATRLINTLTKLNILSSDGIKTDKISNGFIAYVRRMLDNRSGE